MKMKMNYKSSVNSIVDDVFLVDNGPMNVLPRFAEEMRKRKRKEYCKYTLHVPPINICQILADLNMPNINWPIQLSESVHPFPSHVD